MHSSVIRGCVGAHDDGNPCQRIKAALLDVHILCFQALLLLGLGCFGSAVSCIQRDLKRQCNMLLIGRHDSLEIKNCTLAQSCADEYGKVNKADKKSIGSKFGDLEARSLMRYLWSELTVPWPHIALSQLMQAGRA